MMDKILNDEDEAIVEERALNWHLRSWPIPAPSASLDRRIIESYRRRFARSSSRRWYARSIRAPFPLVVAAILIVCAMTCVTDRYLLNASNKTQVVEVIKRVEVPTPIVKKQVEVRTIYLKPEPRKERNGTFDDQAKKGFEAGNALPSAREGNTDSVLNKPGDFQPVREIVIAVMPGSSRHGGKER